MRLFFTFIILLSFGFFTPAQTKLLWFDATANFQRFSYPDSIKYYLDKTKEAGFTDIALDVKPITGEVLYKSSFAPQMTEWGGFSRGDSLDFVNFFITECKKRGLKIHASLNVFVAGHNYFDRGLAYNGRASWQSYNYTDSGIVPITKLKHKYSAMTNPANREVQLHELSIIKELVENYKGLDGIILDRARYDGIEADFSPLSKELFENFIGEAIKRFPEDIYEWVKDSSGNKQRKEGKYYRQWLLWRAKIIYEFFDEARREVKKINPSISYGDYTGAWYPLYYEVGVNWASKSYDPSAEYDWALPEYRNYGYAGLLDFYTTGCYFFEVTKQEVENLNKEAERTEAGMGKGKEYWYSVEGSAEIAMEVIDGAVPVIGGLYVEQYKGHPEQFRRAMKMCLEKTDGLMVFDIVHIINYGWWEYLTLP